MTSPRNPWFVVSLVLIAAFAGYGVRPGPSDRATAQISPAAVDDSTPAAVVSTCNRCAWSYQRVYLDGQPNPTRVQVIPAGVSGILHRVIRINSNALQIGEGDSSEPGAPVIGGLAFTDVDLDIRFANGLWAESGQNGVSLNVTFIYRLD